MGICCCHPDGAYIEVPFNGTCPDGYCPGNVFPDPIFNPCGAAFCAADATPACCFANSPFFECEEGDPNDSDPDSLFRTFAGCVTRGGVPSCPNDCSATNCEDFFQDVLGPCCFLPNGDCFMMFPLECQNFGGQWRGTFWDTCEEVEANSPCIRAADCRDINEPFYQPGDKVHTLQLCEEAVLGFAKRRDEWHNPDNGPNPGSMGMLELVTSHEVRACFITGDDDPCQHSFAIMVKEPSGEIRPYLWSQPDSDIGASRWNPGFFTVQKDPTIDPIEDPKEWRLISPGVMHARTGIEQRVWSEVVYHTDQLWCGNIR